SVLGTCRSVGRADLSAPRGPSGAAAGTRGLQRAGASDVGLGRGNRLACAAYCIQRCLSPLPKGKARARPPRRNAAVPALPFRQPLETLGLDLAEAAFAVHQGKCLGYRLRNVRRPTFALLARCTGARPRHVLVRLSL